MKIAVVHSFYRSEMPSGENIAVELQVKALADAGHDVELVAVRTDDLLSSPLYPLSSALRVSLDLGSNPQELLRRFRPDVIHVHNLFPNWTTSWIRRVAAPVVATVHNYRAVCSAGTLLREGKPCDLCPTRGSQNAVLHRCYRSSALHTLPLAIATRRSSPPRTLSDADAVVFLSERAQSTYSRLGIVPGRSRVIPNFIDSPTQLAPQLTPPRRGLGFDEGYWVFAGRLSEEKGVLNLLDAWSAEDPLVVIGGGPLEQECRFLAQGKRVKFVGVMDRVGVRRLMSSARGLVFPSSGPEPAAALSYLEALSVGTPTIAVGENAVSDDILGNKTGVVAENFALLPEALEKIAPDRHRLRRNALSHYHARYTEQAWLADIESLYESLVSG